MKRTVKIMLCAMFLGVVGRADWRDEMWKRPMGVREGVAIRAFALEKPRLMKAYVARIRLDTPGIGFTATERDADWGKPMPDFVPMKIDTKRETTADFMMRRRAEGRNVVVAANTAPWGPWKPPYSFKYGSLSRWNVSDGVEISNGRDSLSGAFFIIRKDGRAEITSSVPHSETNDVAFAMCGFGLILTNGASVASAVAGKQQLPPRTAFGLTADRKTLVILAIDGRQPGYSLGATYADMAEILLREGCTDAVNMDGGGSTSLVVYDRANDRPVMLNRQPRGVMRKNAVNFGITFTKESETREQDRCGAVLHSYEFHDFADTPPPNGFKPFYISHYGRHGSRRLAGRSAYDALKTLEDAKRSGSLTEKGAELLAAVRQVARAHDEMTGDLTWRGADEHRMLATRMFRRFPEVFAGDRRVRCRATVVPRVLLSQENFTMTLRRLAPGLDFDFITGRYYQRLLTPTDYLKNRAELDGKVDVIVDKLARTVIPFERIVKRFFTTGNAVKGRVRFVRAAFNCAAVCQCLRYEVGDLDMYGLFEPDEIAAFSRCLEAEMYLRMGNSIEFGDFRLSATKLLLGDFLERADNAVADARIAADLRFGHDSGLWPMAGILGIAGPGDRVPAAESYKLCPMWKWMTMASNIQMVFYRNNAGEVLVKILWNEREMDSIRGIAPCNGPYYRWQDLRKMIKERLK